MNISINVAVATHLDDLAKEKAMETQKQTEKIVRQRAEKCRCSYKSPYEDCPNCSSDTKQWGIEE